VSRVFWDTNLFIYLLEGTGSQSDQVVRLRERMLERDDELCTSTLTLGEVLVKPVEQGDTVLCQRYEDVLSGTTRLRRAQAAVDLFVTNDDRLSRLTVPGIQFLVSLDRAFI